MSRTSGGPASPRASAGPPLRLGPQLSPIMPRCSGRDTPLAWFMRTLMRGGNRSAFLCVPGSAAGAEWEHSDVGAPERWWGASWRRGAGGRGGSDRIITCQLHVKQQSSGRWSRANRTQHFPVSFYWTPRAAVPGAWCDVWKCSGLDNCLWFFFFSAVWAVSPAHSGAFMSP